MCSCIFTVGTTVYRRPSHLIRCACRFVSSMAFVAWIICCQLTSRIASQFWWGRSRRLRRTEVVGTDLERLVASHEHPDLLALAVLQQFGHANASFLPFAVFCVESIQLRLAVGCDVRCPLSAPSFAWIATAAFPLRFRFRCSLCTHTWKNTSSSSSPVDVATSSSCTSGWNSALHSSSSPSPAAWSSSSPAASPEDLLGKEVASREACAAAAANPPNPFSPPNAVALPKVGGCTCPSTRMRQPWIHRRHARIAWMHRRRPTFFSSSSAIFRRRCELPTSAEMAHEWCARDVLRSKWTSTKPIREPNHEREPFRVRNRKARPIEPDLHPLSKRDDACKVHPGREEVLHETRRTCLHRGDGRNRRARVHCEARRGHASRNACASVEEGTRP